MPEEKLAFVYECSGGGKLATFQVNGSGSPPVPYESTCDDACWKQYGNDLQQYYFGSGPPEVPDEATCDNACWKKYGNDLQQYYMLAGASATDTSAAAEATSITRVLATFALNLAMFWAYA